ncbi:MAG: hypothetical protein COA69_00510 [Robiginitomaculum sp.]|nr:MAG: hypothetical protein COA69_00510 [Robiginitomaculum sp.]
MKRSIWTVAIVYLSALCLVNTNAQAHVVFGAGQAEGGAYHVADLRIFHGCDGAATVKVTVEIPEGVTRVRPRAISGWDVSIDMVKLKTPVMLHGFEVHETVGSITWSGGALPDFAYEQFDFHIMVPNQPGQVLSFPVHQECVKGRLDWDQKALNMKDFGEMEHPAPFITITGITVSDQAKP